MDWILLQHRLVVSELDASSRGSMPVKELVWLGPLVGTESPGEELSSRWSLCY